MRALLFLLLASVVIHNAAATPPSAQGRTISEVGLIPSSVLKRSISPQFYKTLQVSPIQGYVVVRGVLSGTSMTGLRVVHSEPNSLNDHLALQRADEVRVTGNFSLDNPNTKSPMLLHLLLYKTADGTLALSFAHLDGPGGNQMQYYGCARLAVLKNDGRWVEIKGPEGLEGKGWAVRQGQKNDLKALLTLESVTHGAEATIMSGH